MHPQTLHDPEENKWFRIDGWMDERTDGWMHGWLVGWFDGSLPSDTDSYSPFSGGLIFLVVQPKELQK